MKTKHTPGPWRISENKLSVMANHTIVSHAKNNDDAKLIAAAPDLLNACQKFILFIQDGFDYNGKNTFEMLNEVEEAIKKATL